MQVRSIRTLLEDGSINPGAVRTNFIPLNDLSKLCKPRETRDSTGLNFNLLLELLGNLIDPVAANMLFALSPCRVGKQPASTIFRTTISRRPARPGGSNNKWDIKIDHRFSGNATC